MGSRGHDLAGLLADHAELDVLAPPAGPAATASLQADLPATLTLGLHPGRAPTDATTVTVDGSAPFPLQRVLHA